MTLLAISVLKPQSRKCGFSIERQPKDNFSQSKEATAWDPATFLCSAIVGGFRVISTLP